MSRKIYTRFFCTIISYFITIYTISVGIDPCCLACALSKPDEGIRAARLTDELGRTYAIDPKRITLETEFEDVWVSLDTATPCGLLLHELLTNCFKHAFPEGLTGVSASSSV
jgi:hypothetical protein